MSVNLVTKYRFEGCRMILPSDKIYVRCDLCFMFCCIFIGLLAARFDVPLKKKF